MWNSILRHFQLYPTRTISISFLLVSLFGGFLLHLPISVNGNPISFLDAWFTSTSALCVTGLIVVDTGTKFTLFGQVVILFLIELGGLGIMTFSAIFFTLSGRRLSLSERMIVEGTFLPDVGAQIYSFVKIILFSTLIIETVGAFLIYIFSPGKGVFYSIFHSVSAFCNAGFSLNRDSFSGYVGNIGVNLTIMSLIVLGGIGFFLYYEFYRKFYLKEVRKFSLHTKMVISFTTFLIFFGGIVFFLLESGNSLRGLDFKSRILASLFQSVTSRTAGFNTVDIAILTPGTLLFLIFLMFVGASPGSTGGGIKTTTLGVLYAMARSKLKGREEVDLFKTTIKRRSIARAFSVITISSLIVFFSVFLILIVEFGFTPYKDIHHHFIEILFEVVSAFGTVGLSTGITSTLHPLSRFILIMVMLTGRIGPLTIAHAVGSRYRRGKFKYAEESVMIG